MKILVDLFLVNADLTVIRAGSKTFKTERCANLFLLNNGYRHIVGKEYAQHQPVGVEYQRVAEVTYSFN